MTRKFICLLFISIIGFSCGKSHNSVLSIDEMKPIIWDMLNADNWYMQTSIMDTSFQNKRKNIIFYDKIFKQYDITKEQFYKSYSYYELHPVKMKILLDSVESYGTRAKMNLEKPIPINNLKK